MQVSAGGQTVQAERGFFYPTTTTASMQYHDHDPGCRRRPFAGAATEVAGSGPLGRFLRWGPSDYIVGVVVFFLVLGMLVVLSGVLFPKRDVLAEYTGAMDRTAALGPQALDEPAAAKPGVLSRAAGWGLALRGYQDPLQQMIDDAALKFRASEFALLQVVGVVVLVVMARLLGAPLILALGPRAGGHLRPSALAELEG